MWDLALPADQSDSGPDDGIAGNPGCSVSPRFTTFVSGLIMVSFRTYGIAQCNPWVGRTLLSTYILGAGVRFLHP